MTGFIKGLFSSKQKVEDVAVEATPSAPATPEKQEAFYLDFDEARTFGNVDYMRTAKTVRRTFPKTVSSPEEKELIQEVSAMTLKRATEANGKSVMSERSVAPTPAQMEAIAPKVDEAEERRRTDTNMDMFRNMARQVRK